MTIFSLRSAVCSTVSTGDRKFAANASKCAIPARSRAWGETRRANTHISAGELVTGVAVAITTAPSPWRDRTRSARAKIAFGAL